jgi:hypothetical protein
MLLEDKAGEALREIDRLERQKKQFIKEFGESAAGALADSAAGGDGVGGDGVGGSGPPTEDIRTAVEVPEWLKKPPQYDDWDVKRQMKYVQFHSDIRLRTKMIEKRGQCCVVVRTAGSPVVLTTNCFAF